MLLLSVQNNFYIILSSYVEGQVKKIQVLNFCIFGWFPGLQNLDVFFGKFTVGQVLKSFSGTNDTLKPPVFGFCDSLPFGLENQESLEL